MRYLVRIHFPSSNNVAEYEALINGLRIAIKLGIRRLELSPPWEGPYVVAEVLRLGTYKLKTIDGEVFNNAWNIKQLCCFYP